MAVDIVVSRCDALLTGNSHGGRACMPDSPQFLDPMHQTSVGRLLSNTCSSWRPCTVLLNHWIVRQQGMRMLGLWVLLRGRL